MSVRLVDEALVDEELRGRIACHGCLQERMARGRVERGRRVASRGSTTPGIVAHREGCGRVTTARSWGRSAQRPGVDRVRRPGRGREYRGEARDGRDDGGRRGRRTRGQADEARDPGRGGAATVAWAAQAIGRPAPVSATSGSFDSSIGNAVSGTTTSTESFAIFGTSAAGTGTGGGILGASASPNGTGVKGAVFDPKSGKYGVWGYAETASRSPSMPSTWGRPGRASPCSRRALRHRDRGLWRGTDAVADHENYGVFGLSHSALGRGVFGWAESASAGTGVWGQTDGASGAGVQGFAWDGDAATGQFGTGVIGTSGTHAFPAAGAAIEHGRHGLQPQRHRRVLRHAIGRRAPGRRQGPAEPERQGERRRRQVVGGGRPDGQGRDRREHADHRDDPDVPPGRVGRVRAAQLSIAPGRRRST